MVMYNANNERVKRQYFAYLKEAKRHNELTLDAVAKALSRFESDSKFRDFKTFHFEQAIAFKRHLAEQRGQASGELLSKATLYSTLAHLKRFFHWLAGQPGYKSRFKYSDAEYFNLSDKEARIATARRERPFPTMEQARNIIGQMPAASEIDRRNRALVAFTLLTGARDTAIASMKMKHIDLDARCIHQDAREVKTKFSKTFTTYFFPIGDEVYGIVAGWVNFLRQDKLWGNEDPLFPSTQVSLGAVRRFVAVGLSREHWSSAAPIRAIFRDACKNAGMPYFNPHSIRKTLVSLGESLCKTAEQFKAWSQNLGHEGVLTTFYSYGSVAIGRQGEIMQDLAKPQNEGEFEAVEIAKAVVLQLLSSTRGHNN